MPSPSTAARQAGHEFRPGKLPNIRAQSAGFAASDFNVLLGAVAQDLREFRPGEFQSTSGQRAGQEC
eukprot:521200-Alexandrium_andersonii.AAC.1